MIRNRNQLYQNHRDFGCLLEQLFRISDSWAANIAANVFPNPESYSRSSTGKESRLDGSNSEPSPILFVIAERFLASKNAVRGPFFLGDAILTIYRIIDRDWPPR